MTEENYIIHVKKSQCGKKREVRVLDPYLSGGKNKPPLVSYHYDQDGEHYVVLEKAHPTDEVREKARVHTEEEQAEEKAQDLCKKIAKKKADDLKDSRNGEIAGMEIKIVEDE
jgi:hypothetical protein